MISNQKLKEYLNSQIDHYKQLIKLEEDTPERHSEKLIDRYNARINAYEDSISFLNEDFK